MREIENDCVQCEMGCINCGRKHALHIYCDECEKQVGADEVIEEDGKDYCPECYNKLFEKEDE